MFDFFGRDAERIENVPVFITLPKKCEAIWKPVIAILVGRSLSNFWVILTLSIFFDVDLTRIIVGNSDEKIKTKWPPNKISSKVGILSKKKNAEKRRMEIIVKLSFLNRIKVNPININKLKHFELFFLFNYWIIIAITLT